MKTQLNLLEIKIASVIALCAFSCNILLAQPWMQKPWLTSKANQVLIPAQN